MWSASTVARFWKPAKWIRRRTPPGTTNRSPTRRFLVSAPDSLRFKSARLLFFADADRRPGCIPRQIHGAGPAPLVEGNGEILKRRGEFSQRHGDTREVVSVSRIRNAPLT